MASEPKLPSPNPRRPHPRTCVQAVVVTHHLPRRHCLLGHKTLTIFLENTVHNDAASVRRAELPRPRLLGLEQITSRHKCGILHRFRGVEFCRRRKTLHFRATHCRQNIRTTSFSSRHVKTRPVRNDLSKRCRNDVDVAIISAPKTRRNRRK